MAYCVFPDNGPHMPIQSPFSVDLPYGEAGGRSPGNPLFIKDGLFKGQMFVPDADGAYGGICRVFLEKIKEEWQGATFYFSQGFESQSVYRIVWGPDGALYAGANGSYGAAWTRMTYTGLDRIKPNGNKAFEMLAVRSLGATSFEIEFTKPLGAALGADVTANLEVSKWWDRPNEGYGTGRKQDVTALVVGSAKVSADRLKATIVMAGIEEGWEYYFHWKNDILSTDAGEKLWGTEAWYTLNHYGPGIDGSTVSMEPKASDPRFKPDSKNGFSIKNQGQDIIVQPVFASDAFITTQILDLTGRLLALRSSRGSAPMVFSKAALPEGAFIIKVKSGDKFFSKIACK